MADVAPPEGFTLDPAPPEGFKLDPSQAKPVVQAPPGWTLTPEKYEPSVTDRFLQGTSLGRIVSALGHGASEGWGTEPLGISPETDKALRDVGIFPGLHAGWRDAGRTAVEAVMYPTAALLDAFMRTGSAAVTGAAAAGGQAAQEYLGMEPAEAMRLARDLNFLGQSAMTVLGSETGPGVTRGGRTLGSEAAKLDAPVVEGGTAAQRPFAPPVSAAPAAPPVPTGFVRFYHGGVPGTEGPRWLTPDIAYAESYAAKSTGGVVQYVDIPESHPSLVKAFDDEGATVKAPYVSFEAPEALAQQLKLYSDRSSAPPTEPGPTYAAAESKPPPKYAPETARQSFDKADDGPVDRAGNINLNYIDNTDKVHDILKDIAEKNDNFMAQRRGVISMEQTQDLARSLGMTPEELAKRKIGEAYNAEQIDAARTLLRQSLTALHEAGAKMRSGTEADTLAYLEVEARHTMIQGQVSGIAAEQGRGLNIFKVMKESTDKAKAIKQIMDEYGGAENVALRARMIADLDTPEQVARFLRDARKSTLREKLQEIYVNSVLSGLRTQGTNILSNFANAFWVPVETLGTATVGAARRALPERIGGVSADAERVMFGEVGARLYGIVQGSKEGVILGKKAFLEEATSDGVTNLDFKPQAVPGKIGSAIRVPGRALVAVDEYFKAVARRQELNALAYRQASREGLRGEEFGDRINDLVNNPTKKMQDAAEEFARKQTFQSELGPFGKGLQALSNANLPAKMIVTFVRAPINILKYANEMTPLGLFAKKVRDNLAGKNGKIAQDTQIAKLAAGSAIMVTAYNLAAEGILTGAGPKDPAERAMWFLSGKQPYSVKIGDYYYSHRALGPFSVLLGVAADLHEIRDNWDELDADKAAAMLLGSVTNNIVNQSWARGAAGFLQAVEDPTRYGERYLQQLTSPVVPNLVAQIAQTQDPYLRDVRSIVDNIKVRAGFPGGVPIRRDIWGEPITRGGSLGPDLISPIYEHRVNLDPVNQELTALKVWPSALDRKIRGVDLTDQQYDDYQRIAGRFAKYQLDRMVAMQSWHDIPAAARVESIKRTIDRARSFGRAQVLLQNPQLFSQVVAKRIKGLSPPVASEEK